MRELAMARVARASCMLATLAIAVTNNKRRRDQQDQDGGPDLGGRRVFHIAHRSESAPWRRTRQPDRTGVRRGDGARRSFRSRLRLVTPGRSRATARMIAPRLPPLPLSTPASLPGCPCRFRTWETEIPRHHADDRVGPAIEFNDPPRISSRLAEALLPKSLRQDHADVPRPACPRPARKPGREWSAPEQLQYRRRDEVVLGRDASPRR